MDSRGEINVAAVAAVATARAASRHKLFAPEGNTAVTAVTCFDCNFGFVDERGSILPAESK